MSIITITDARMRNAQVLTNKLAQAFEQWAWEDINGKYWEQQFKTPKWDYPGETKRKSSTALIRDADSPRDIYDYGKLYDSGVENCNVTLSPTTAMASWKWDAKNEAGQAYARYVHDGSKTNLKPREWTDELAVPQKFDTSEIKQELLNRIRAAFSS